MAQLDRDDYTIYEIPEMPFEACCNEKICHINKVFDCIVDEVNKRRIQLIDSVEGLKREYLEWKRYHDKVMADGSKMYTEAEHRNFEKPFHDLKEKQIQEVKAKIDSIKQEEAYYHSRELHFHIDKPSINIYIRSIGRLRLKQALDYYQDIKISNKPLCAKFNPLTNHYYVLTSRNILILDEAFQTIKSFPLIVPIDAQIQRVSVGGIAIGSEHIYISIPSHCLIQKYLHNGYQTGTIGTRGSGYGELMSPEGIEIHPKSFRLYVCEFDNDRIQVFDQGQHHIFIGDRDGRGGGLRRPKSIAITNHGKVIVLHKSYPCINVYTEDGELLSQYGSMLVNGEFRGLSWIETTLKGVEVGTTVNGRVSLIPFPRDIIVELNTTKSAGCDENLGGIAVGRKGQVMICDTINKRLVGFKLNNYIPLFTSSQ
ncbi:Cell surface protein [Oopsacas minuta]|uniref:Cell surface protein n=1 Tax=Oopsacas minuta TaxID=111878 RepID=A0AAV7JMV6_9METZ|nr:Cell surface protein [Oopsacas minuta]